jgi:outer membrane immunogenic protein
MLRRILLTSAGAMALMGAAHAAEPLPPPPPPPPPIWTGFYVGVTAGAEWSNNASVSTAATTFANSGLVDPLPAVSAGLATNSWFVHPAAGFIGGATGGYNYQFSPSFVAGIELDFSGVVEDVKGPVVSREAFIPGFAPDLLAQSISNSQNLDFFGTIRGRLGYLVTPTWLVYGTGGLAYGEASAHTTLTQFVSGPNAALIGLGANNPYYLVGFPACGSSAILSTTAVGFPGTEPCGYSTVRVGWTAGGGVEWMFMPNWSIKLEYLYYHLGTANYTPGYLQNPQLVSPPTVPFLYSSHVTSSASFNGNVVRIGLNWKFYTWPAPVAPVVAKY